MGNQFFSGPGNTVETRRQCRNFDHLFTEVPTLTMCWDSTFTLSPHATERVWCGGFRHFVYITPSEVTVGTQVNEMSCSTRHRCLFGQVNVPRLTMKGTMLLWECYDHFITWFSGHPRGQTPTDQTLTILRTGHQCHGILDNITAKPYWKLDRSHYMSMGSIRICWDSVENKSIVLVMAPSRTEATMVEWSL